MLFEKLNWKLRAPKQNGAKIFGRFGIRYSTPVYMARQKFLHTEKFESLLRQKMETFTSEYRFEQNFQHY